MVATGDVDKGGHRLADVLAAWLEKLPQDGAYPLADGRTTTAVKKSELLLTELPHRHVLKVFLRPDKADYQDRRRE